MAGGVRISASRTPAGGHGECDRALVVRPLALDGGLRHSMGCVRELSSLPGEIADDG